MDEKDLDKELKKLRWKEPDKSVMESHKKAFGKRLFRYVYVVNARENKRRKMRLVLTYSLAVIVLIAFSFFFNFQMQKRMFYNIAFSNPSVTSIYKGVMAQRTFKPKIIKVMENKNLGIARLYTNMRIFVIVDLKENKVVGVGIPLSKEKKYTKKKFNLTEDNKRKALKIISNDPLIKRLNKKSTAIKNQPSFFAYGPDQNAFPKIAEVEIKTQSGKTITAFVDISKNRVLDITDMKNVIGELITKDPDIHYFLYIDEDY